MTVEFWRDWLYGAELSLRHFVFDNEKEIGCLLCHDERHKDLKKACKVCILVESDRKGSLKSQVLCSKHNDGEGEWLEPFEITREKLKERTNKDFK